MNGRPWMHVDPAQIPAGLKEPAMDAGYPPDRRGIDGEEHCRSSVSAAAAAAERERIKAAGTVSACCGASYTRPPGAYSRWTCGECGQDCDLIGVIA